MDPAGGFAGSLDGGQHSAIRTAMIAITTNSSIRVKPRTNGRGRHGRRPSCRVGQEGSLRPSGARSVADGLRAARPDACGRSIGTEARRAGLLAFGSERPRTAFPPCGSGSIVRGPGRIQRRPRDGFAPSSLFSPGPFPNRRHLSRIAIRVERIGQRQESPCEIVPTSLPLMSGLRSR